MYVLLFILLPTVTLTNGKPTLIANLGKLGIGSTELDIVAIDPTKGNVSFLYKLPNLYGLNSNIWVCLRVDSERNLIHVLAYDDLLSVEQTFLHELNLADGHLINTYNISKNGFGTAEQYSQWDFDPDTRTLYGICLNTTNTTLQWNYVWCSVKFDENGLGKTQHGFFASVDGDPPGPGDCNGVSMNRNTFSTGEYWYTVYNEIFVRHVTSLMGEPGEMLWTVKDKMDPPLISGILTGKTNEYVIVLRLDGGDGVVVAKLNSSGDEELIAKLPPNLIPDGPPWAYDPINEMLYVLMKTDLDQICDTLVKVNLTQPSSVHTVPVSLKSLFDPKLYFVNDMHLVEWPPITPGP